MKHSIWARELVKETHASLSSLPTIERNKQIIQIVREKTGEIVNSDDIYEITTRIRQTKERLKDIGEELESVINELNEDDKKAYEIVELDNVLHYLFATKDKQYKIPVSQIDAMFKDYSRKGGDLSGEAMRQKYRLKPEAWGIIKSRLHLQKDSHVISPYTLENLSEEEEDAVIERATVDHIDTKIGKFVNTYEKQFKARAMDAMKRLENKNYLLDEYKKVLDECKPKEYEFVPKVINNNDEKMVIITDIHFGKIGHDMVMQRMESVYNSIVASPERIIYLTCLGDMFEKLSQEDAHAGQSVQGIDPSFGYGFDAVLKVATIFEKFITGLQKEGKKVIFNGVGGNHDRMTKKNEDDIERSWALFVYETLKSRLASINQDINYTRKLLDVIKMGKIGVLYGHGEYTKNKVQEIIMEHGLQDTYMVYIHGHYHNAVVSEGRGYTDFQVSGLAGRGAYDAGLNLFSQPGYGEIKENEFGTADLAIKRVNR